ncbi:MAG: hypothetical protein JRL30_20350 [Deltaproteobacteria bacterium]|nr:hypothetical protein [Deltaproteobacteria bacterium]
MKTPFFDDQKKQAEYETRLDEMVKAYTEHTPRYNQTFHLQMLQDLVQSEMMYERLSRSISNDTEGSMTIELRQKEQRHINHLRRELGITPVV